MITEEKMFKLVIFSIFVSVIFLYIGLIGEMFWPMIVSLVVALATVVYILPKHWQDIKIKKQQKDQGMI